MKRILTIQCVVPELRNFLVREEIDFKKPEKNPLGNLRVEGCSIVKDLEGGKIRLSFKGRLIELPPHIRYYENVLTTEARTIGQDKKLATAGRIASRRMKRS